MFSGLSWEIWGSGIWVKLRQRAVTFCAADKQPLEHVSAQRQANACRCAADWGGWLLLTQQHVDQLTCRDTSSLVWMKQDGCAHSRASEMWPACAYKSHCGGDDRLLQGHCDVPFTARPDTSKKKQTAHWWSKNTTEAFHVSQGKG